MFSRIRVNFYKPTQAFVAVLSAALDSKGNNLYDVSLLLEDETLPIWALRW